MPAYLMYFLSGAWGSFSPVLTLARRYHLGGVQEKPARAIAVISANRLPCPTSHTAVRR